MADVFISYARSDYEDARELARKLSERGLSVWWDHQLLPGDRFRRELEFELQKALCVIVLWSPESVKSHFVIDEADFALRQAKLIPLMLRLTEVPLGFRSLHYSLYPNSQDQLDIVLSRLNHALIAPRPDQPAAPTNSEPLANVRLLRVTIVALICFAAAYFIVSNDEVLNYPSLAFSFLFLSETKVSFAINVFSVIVASIIFVDGIEVVTAITKRVAIRTVSFGFGPTLLSISANHTEWRVGLIPFGGYVQYWPTLAQHGRLNLRLFGRLGRREKFVVVSTGTFVLLLTATMVLGVPRTLRYSLETWYELASVTLTPLSLPVGKIDIAYAFYNSTTKLEFYAATAAKIVGFNLLPIGLTAGGEIILILLGYDIDRYGDNPQKPPNPNGKLVRPKTPHPLVFITLIAGVFALYYLLAILFWLRQ